MEPIWLTTRKKINGRKLDLKRKILLTREIS
jgi:hypothetical protein